MTVSLDKGGNVSLDKLAGGAVTDVTVGLGWDVRTTSGDPFDLDAEAFVLDGTDKVLSEKWFIFFGNKNSPDGSVVHHGDNLTGDGDGDDEQITIKLTNLPATAEKVVIAVTIYKADERKQNFGMVRNAFARVVNDGDSNELVRFDLGEDFSLETAVTCAELYRKGGEWKFKAIGQGYNNGLAGLCRDYGVPVG